MAGRTYLYAISLAAHAAAVVALLAIPARRRHEIVAISVSEAAKPKPKPETHIEPPPEPPKPAVRTVRAKAAPAAPKPAEAAPESAAPSGDAIPDFGIALSNGPGGGGFAVPAPRAASAPTPAATTKTLKSLAPAHAAECDEPEAKPKLVSRPTPVYTDQARAGLVSGKVRVEITVDEHGRVVTVRVLQGLGYGLDEAATNAARGMVFEPAIRCGKPSSATFKVGFTFSPSGTP